MFSSPTAGKSVDNLSPLSSGARADYPIHSRQGQGHPRPVSRRGSTASSINSIGGTLDATTSSNWGGVMFETGKNAISTLLQPPIVRTGLQPHISGPGLNSHKPPTAKDIPPVTLTNIPHVDPEEFAPYLSQVGALYEQLRRMKETDDEGNNNKKNARQDDLTDAVGEGYLRPTGKARITRQGSSASLSSLNSIETPSSGRRASSGLSRKSLQGPPPLSTIPAVYFDDDFRLENPRTFDIVSERSEVVRPTNSDGRSKEEVGSMPRKALATNAILQEKLSWYMDTIEVHLINSISTASTTFFTALGSLKELHSEAADSVQRINLLRKELQALDEEVGANGLAIVEKRRRQENLRQLNDAVQQLKLIVDGVADCELLVDKGEVDEALASIDSLEKLISGERDEDLEVDSSIQLRDLTAASALQGVNADLNILRFRIGKAYDTQFSSLLISDLRRHLESVSSSEVLLRWGNAASRARGTHARSSSAFPSYLSATSALKAQLLPNMVGLHRAKHVATAALSYRETALREIRNIIRRPLPSSNDDDNESMMSVSTAGGGRHLSSHEKSTNLARNLRALDGEDGEELLTNIYVGVTETLRRLSTQVKVLLDIASSLTDLPMGDAALKSPPVRSPVTSPRPDRYVGTPTGPSFELQEELHKALDVGNLLAQAVDVANEKIVKILKVRSEQATNLPLDLFLRYFTLNLYFANECEAISGRSGTSLKTVVNGHIVDFVQRHREVEMQKLAQGMESDQWSARDFTDQNTELLNQILECSTQDAEAWTESNRIWVPYQVPSKAGGEDGIAPETNGTVKNRCAVIDSEKFILPNSAVLCLDGTGSFLRLTAGIPSMTADIASSLVAYLQLFNSRCTQLILGAGATRSAGLRNITTRHLALASQALSFIATLVPHIREFVRRHSGSGTGVSSLMGEFDKVRRLLQEHQDSIHQKLVDIMSARASVHAKTLKAINWDANNVEGPSLYMETLAKETTTLHRNLTKHLPETSVQLIMMPVFASYRDQLGDAFRQTEMRLESGQNRMMQDVELLRSRLGRIEGFGDTGDFLAGVIKSREVVAETPAQAPDNDSSALGEPEAPGAVPSEETATEEVTPTT